MFHNGKSWKWKTFGTIEIVQSDIIGVTETWANEGLLDSELAVEGYDLFWRDRNNNHNVKKS